MQVYVRKNKSKRVNDLFLEAADPFTIYFKPRNKACKLAQTYVGMS